MGSEDGHYQMDMCLIGTEEGTKIQPVSVHGMLWLQTHFEDIHWEALASGYVKLPKNDAEMLSEDAKEAGLQLNNLPLLSNQRLF